MKWLKSIFSKSNINGDNITDLCTDDILSNEAKSDIKKIEEEINVEQTTYIYPDSSLIKSNNSSLFLDCFNIIKGSKNTFCLKKYGEDDYLALKLDTLPNLLIGGTIMTGKSSLINSIICSLIMTSSPQELKLVLLDSKKIELSMYNLLPHLLTPVITDFKRGNIALKRVLAEIERRYDVLRESGVKNIESYNQYIDKLNEDKSNLKKIHQMPHIVLVIDEFTSFSNNDEENVSLIENISNMGYVVGVYVILVVNHPSANVISTLAQSNFSSRISFKTITKQDSRLILDDNGAESLNSQGICLYKSLRITSPIKLISPFIEDTDIKNIINFIFEQQKPIYNNTFLTDQEESIITDTYDNESDYEEPLYNEIVEFVVSSGKASASLLQRRFRLGYNRAARCIDLLEERGILGPQNGSKPREVLIKKIKD